MSDNLEPISKNALAARAVEGGIRAALNVDHLYVSDDGTIRDSHIENMFDDLFYGRPLDMIFRNNFGQYFNLLTGGEDIPPDVFDNVTSMRNWVSLRFGTLLLTPARSETLDENPDLEHCKYRAVFREPARFNIDACYAPSELHAGLLAVVTVFRQLAQQFNDDRLIAKPGELN